MSEEFAVVERGAIKRSGRVQSALTAAVLDTVNTGKAVRIALNGRSKENVFNNLYHAAGRRGLKTRRSCSKDDPGVMFVWCERKEAK